MLRLMLFFVISIFSISLCANNIDIVGLSKKDINLNANNTINKKSLKAIPKKQVSLLKVNLSNDFKKHLNSKLKFINKSHNNQFIKTNKGLKSPIPAQIDLGMNEVPVLDQGIHGSCVTFALTAALNAALFQDDYISQLCLLQLGTYLEQNSNFHSGWQGEYTRNVLTKLKYFGAIRKIDEATGCGSLTSYPLFKEHTGAITLEEYNQKSENIFANHNVKIKKIIDIDENNVDDLSLTEETLLENIKLELTNGNRIVLGVLMVSEIDQIANAHSRAFYDSWVLNNKISEQIIKNNIDIVKGAHEMVVIGYDDNAEAIDSYGKRHKGLLKVRNSWSDLAGDKGDYYISYDYLLAFILDAYSVYKKI